MLTPMKAIRAKCLDCCCGSANEVRLCPAQDCPLWGYRSGHNPNRAGIGKMGISLQNPNSRADLEAQAKDLEVSEDDEEG